MRPLIGIHGIGSQPDEDFLNASWSQATKQQVKVVRWSDITEDNLDIAKEIAPINALVDEVMKKYPQTWLAPFYSATVVKRAIMDVVLYVKVPAIRERVKQRLHKALSAYVMSPIRPIILAHSLGSVIAYEVMRERMNDTASLITIGSPLGMELLKANMPKLIIPAGIDKWHNFADRLDPVALDSTLQNDFLTDKILDFEVKNLDRWRLSPHSATGYLGLMAVRKSIFDFQVAP